MGKALVTQAEGPEFSPQHSHHEPDMLTHIQNPNVGKVEAGGARWLANLA